MSQNNAKGIDYTKILIFLAFCISIIISNYNLNNYDKYFEKNGNRHDHVMIKYDTLRYLSHGDNIKNDLKNGKNFFETGREHFTKYLPPRLAAAYYYFFDLNLFNKDEKIKVNLGIHFPYLIIQNLFYYLSLLFLYVVIAKKLDKKVCLSIILFLAIEPTIFQYHGTFWSESFFFSLQLFLLALILQEKINFYYLFLIGVALSLLSLQKQLAYFYILPILFYYFIYLKKNDYYKLSFLLIGFFCIQLIPGYNNFVRSGNFYVLTADTKIAVYRNIIVPIMEKNNANQELVRINEGKVALNWLQKNSIKFDVNIKNIKKKVSTYTFEDYRKTIINEKDKIKYDEFFAKRSIQILLDNPLSAFTHVLNNSLHIILLNPFHIYSDHHFKSGERYYSSNLHDRLIKYRVIYSLIIYLISLAGLYYMIKSKKYKLFFLTMLSILYFYSFVSWHGNTRYYVPVLVYLSFFFGFGCKYLLQLKVKKSY